MHDHIHRIKLQAGKTGNRERESETKSKCERNWIPGVANYSLQMKFSQKNLMNKNDEAKNGKKKKIWKSRYMYS